MDTHTLVWSIAGNLPHPYLGIVAILADICTKILISWVHGCVYSRYIITSPVAVYFSVVMR